MPTKAEFKEKGRIATSDTTEVVLSEVLKGKDVTGFSTNKFVKSERFEGFTKGIFIPEDCIQDYLALYDIDDLQSAIEKKKEK